MRTIEEIKREIREAEQKLYRLKNEVFDIEFFDNVDKYAYQEIQEKILFLQSEINNDILYIKTTYNQLLSIRTSAELLVRRNNDPDAIETSKKIHQAFIMLIEYNKLLENKIDKFNALLTERETFLEKSKYRDAVLKAEDNII